MSRKILGVVTGVCVLALAALTVVPAFAQEVKEKPPMYSYVGIWSIPRAHWGDMEKAGGANNSILAKGISDGSLVGYGSDVNLVHQADGDTHDSWWSGMSMAGILNILDQFHQAGTSTSPVLAGATKHWDEIFVSRFYNWRPGTYKGAYTHGGSYKLKADAGPDAVEMLAKSMVVPMLEKALADGTIVEYEIDTEAIHMEAPGTFFIFYISPNAEGLDKVNAMLRESSQTNPLRGAAFASMVDMSAHRDTLARTNATYK